MEKILAAIQAIDDDFCRIVLIGTLEGRHPDAIFRILNGLDPTLSREEFDRRVIACRQQLWDKLNEDNR